MNDSKRSLPADSKTKRIAAADPAGEPIDLAQEPTPPLAADKVKRAGDGPGLTRSAGGGRVCRRCGYDLSGLEAAKVCPECGFTTRVRRGRVYSDQLAAAPLEWLRMVNVAAKCMALGMALWISGVIVMEFGGDPALIMWPVAGLVLFSIGGVMVLKDRAASEYETGDAVRDMARARRYARWGLGAVVIAGAGAYADRFFSSGLWAVFGLVVVAALAGLASCVVLVLYMRRLALWANDDSTASVLQWNVLAMPIGVVAPLIWVSWFGMTGVAGFLLSMLTVRSGLIVIDGMMMFGLVKFERMTAWAIDSNIAHMDRAMREAERRLRAERALEARLKGGQEQTATDRERGGGPSHTNRAGG